MFRLNFTTCDKVHPYFRHGQQEGLALMPCLDFLGMLSLSFSIFDVTMGILHLTYFLLPVTDDPQ